MKKVLAIINIVVITILLFISSIMVYFSSSSQRELMGYTALLFYPADAASPSLYLIKHSGAPLVAGDEVILSMTNLQGDTAHIIDKITKNNNNVLSFAQNEVDIDLTSADYTFEYSTIIYKNAALGRMIFALTNNVSPVLIYVIIIGGAIVISLVWVLAVMVRRGKHTYFTPTNPLEVFINDETETADMVELIPSDSLQFSYVQEQVELTTAVTESPEPEAAPPLEHTLSFDVNAMLDEIIANANKDFLKHQNDN